MPGSAYNSSAFVQTRLITRIVPVTGDTIVIPDSLLPQTIIIAPATDLANLTIQWPSTPFNGQEFRILTTKAIAVLGHTNGSINRALNSIPSSGDMTLIYDQAGSTYMCGGVSQSFIVSLPFTASTAGGAGDAIFYATDSGLVGGNALFASIQDVTAKLDVADPNVAFSKPVVSNSNKTVTTNVKKQTFNVITLLSTNILGSATLGNAPNAVALSFLVHGVLA